MDLHGRWAAADWRMTGCGLSESTSKWVRITWACQCRRNDLLPRPCRRNSLCCEDYAKQRSFCRFLVSIVATCKIIIPYWYNNWKYLYLIFSIFKRSFELCRSIIVTLKPRIVREKRSTKNKSFFSKTNLHDSHG